MNRKARISNVKEKLTKYSSLVLKIAIFYFAVDVAVLNDFSLVKWLSNKHELKKIRQEVLKTEQENVKLAKENQKLENDPQAIETIAREKYGMKKPGEQVYRFVSDEDDKDKKGK